MKSNVRCWTPPAVGLLIAMLLLVGCATVSSDALARCPPIVDYNPTDQASAAVEVETLSETSMVVRMLSDYAVLREQARACR
ncbi:hypothetical protein [Roseicitreum antarcticum]|uniref:Uncharacterized protein n=1 Tax=Roseicitreum antarcticum TaxID=564137 RepID=A0A1H3F8Y3_9RHOB|nr:hypothetical protein [Roseicitreum antarcticum]SDX87380.1 hypothetical protein SAMN04488238_13411 [Roseicitreum antarcticum]